MAFVWFWLWIRWDDAAPVPSPFFFWNKYVFAHFLEQVTSMPNVGLEPQTQSRVHAPPTSQPGASEESIFFSNYVFKMRPGAKRLARGIDRWTDEARAVTC